MNYSKENVTSESPEVKMAAVIGNELLQKGCEIASLGDLTKDQGKQSEKEAA
jgi:hypothetical protein